MVPVLDILKNPLMPCSEKRARKLMEKGEAKAFWKNGVFCIILQKNPSGNCKQDIVIGIDPGSKRTGITITTETKVIANQLFNTPSWVKKHVEFRKIMRRSRRQRHTPYRKCRHNRKIGGVPPSTKARWAAHLRVITFWRKLVPLNKVVIEDIQAVTKKGKRQWNVNFSPLEVGKKWCYDTIRAMGLTLYTFKGFETRAQRLSRGFKKTTDKLKDVWDAHNVDSHCLCELVSGNITPFKGLLRCNFFEWGRRQLHVAKPAKGGLRKLYGSTLSLELVRGTLVKTLKYGLSFIGGTYLGRISLHDVKTGKRIARRIKKQDLKVLSILRWRTAFLSDLQVGKLSCKI